MIELMMLYMFLCHDSDKSVCVPAQNLQQAIKNAPNQPNPFDVQSHEGYNGMGQEIED